MQQSGHTRVLPRQMVPSRWKHLRELARRQSADYHHHSRTRFASEIDRGRELGDEAAVQVCERESGGKVFVVMDTFSGVHLWTQRNGTCDALSRLTDGAMIPEVLSKVRRVSRPTLKYRVRKTNIENEACQMAAASCND